VVEGPKIRNIVEAGTQLKEQLRESIKKNQEKFFSQVISHQQIH
jgi:hypothetical protein